MNRKGTTPLIGAVVVLLLVFGAVAFVLTQTDFIGSTVGAGGDCKIEPYTLNGQTFSTMQDAKTTYQRLGGDSWEQLKEAVDLQVRDGVVKARLCETN